MASPLDFPSSEVFRKKLVVRNLVPYKKSPKIPDPPYNYETIQRDLSPVDTDDSLIDTPILANLLYPLNQYGAEGGYKQVPYIGALQNTNSNEGEYGFQDANIIDEGFSAAQVGFPGIAPAWKPLNAYASTDQLTDSAEFFGSLEILTQNNGRSTNAQPYPNFNPSSYPLIGIMLNPDPQGSDGLLSSDSFLAKLGATSLRRQIEYNIAQQIRNNTRGRANFLNVNGGEDILAFINGRVPLLEPNWNITEGSTIVGAAAGLLNRISGSYAPFSVIPGNYFDSQINSRIPTTGQQLASAFLGPNAAAGLGRFFARLNSQSNLRGSILFLENTGGGQRSQLFKNIDYNLYKPGYDRPIFDRVAGALQGRNTNNGEYYIGSVKSEPSQVFSPSGDVPVDQFGREIQAPVYGPQELAQLYEGPGQALNLGANGPTYSSGGDIVGGFTWVSPKFKGNAGKFVGQGGDPVAEDPDFRPSAYQPTESTEFEFRQGSIMDDTQRIIDSQPRGGRRLQHVGNAIDQVSKVFNDGYKEITKGSKVKRYVGAIGAEVGVEYCRIFQKDTPYLQYNDLQKVDGITTEGRRFSYSIFDKTYNLNIAPNKREGGQDSTNIIGGPNGYAKKYMFSLENLAWRTSNRPGYTVADLPVCERGPNGGRVMWFPPYGLTFSESTRASFKQTDFIGRPEPVFTYSNSSRSGSLSWKIVVDHPSVLNMLVNRVLNDTNIRQRADDILDSFFAGCRKYDLYELARKYYTVNPNDIFEIQQRLQTKNVPGEDVEYYVRTIQTGGFNTTDGGTQGAGGTLAAQTTQISSSGFDYTKLQNYGLYFDNDIPKPDLTVSAYPVYYNSYVSSSNKQFYQTKASALGEAVQVANFFTQVVEGNKEAIEQMLITLDKDLENDKQATCQLVLESSASNPQTEAYNLRLSERRQNSSLQYILGTGNLNTYFNDGRLTITTSFSGENITGLTVNPVGVNGITFGKFKCTGQDSLSRDAQVYTVNAMACRRTAITGINFKGSTPPPNDVGVPEEIPFFDEQIIEQRRPKQPVTEVVEETVFRDNITKRVLRSLLSECDYFEVIKQDTPMVYDSLREKLKFFHPAFHSITPEGLNSRLTFLQQCMRPGDTIPTVQVDNQGGSTLQYNNAVNTSFGTPPVLILRVGDFFHSKIIPDNLNITYEDLDLNPEGIGVQPMIANITLSFQFVGGQGLKESVDKLQNALSFNYYANTEIYDDRADATDDSYKVIDQQFLDQLNLKTPPPTINQATNTQPKSNLEFIGKVLTTTNTPNGNVGTIQYKDYMTSVVGETQNYFATINNKIRDLNLQYNNAVRQQFSFNRRYREGQMLADNLGDGVPLFGKPSTFEKDVNDVFSAFIDDIDNNSEGYITYLNEQVGFFSNKTIRVIKNNYKDFVNSYRGEFQNGATSILQNIVDTQTSYIQTLSRANVLLFNVDPTQGTDGYQRTDGNAVVIDISGTTEVSPSSTGVSNTLDELVLDLGIIVSELISFETAIENEYTANISGKSYTGFLATTPNEEQTIKTKVFIPFTESDFWEPVSNARQYFILSQQIIDENKYNTFRNAIIGNLRDNTSVLGNVTFQQVEASFDNYWKGVARPVYQLENGATNEFLTDFQTSELKKFLNFAPFNLNKERIFTYETNLQPQSEQIQLVKNLGNKNNIDTNVSSWTTSFGNVIIGKAQLL
jgi:hypothetical protein